MNPFINSAGKKTAITDPVLLNALKQDGAKRIISQPECQAVLLAQTPVFLCHGSDPALFIDFLSSQNPMPPAIIRCDDQDFARKICKEFPHLKATACTPWFWTEENAPELSGSLSFRLARKTDLSLIKSHYDLASRQELLNLIESDLLWLAMDGHTAAGFAGFHEEGSVGLLEIFKPYRKRGFGLETEHFLIGQALNRSLIPYCDVFNTNTISQHLQKKAGLQKGNPIWWITPLDEGPF